MENQNQTPAFQLVKPKANIMAAYAKFVDRAAYHGFIQPEDDEETGLPNPVLYSFSATEDRRIWVHSLFDGEQPTHERFVVIDRFIKNPFSNKEVSEYRQTVFYRGTFDLTDLDFFEKLLLSIFPKPVTF
ncbi:hypothetical protein [Spirosoma aerolatum]|uniref:hypothetical protein n=1 Tax=Spirosoma aerolatum TaxID=1211326 RepID=UPI0009AE94F9|nr:hypothetical protein [Spirosoma aerolatum]